MLASSGLELLLPAVHLSDGILTAGWQAGGFALAGLLALWGARHIVDEEIPRLALLTSVFFVASSVHLRVGPTSVHLLLNGLLGVLLGRRAALAIPVGLLLQMMLLGHGGWGTLGVNSCLMVLPALAASGLFHLLQRLPRRPGVRVAFVGLSTFAWLASLVYSVSLLATNPIGQVDSLDTTRATALVLQPGVLLLLAAASGLGAWLERRLEHEAEFACGLLVGSLAVLATLVLTAAVLLVGGQEDWPTIALLVFVAHLPIVVVEGCVVGCAVGFLARVKPELLHRRAACLNRDDAPPKNVTDEPGSGNSSSVQQAAPRAPIVLLTLLGILLPAAPAFAHRLLVECRILPGNQVQVNAWFDGGGGPPAGAAVQVFRGDQQRLAEGKLDKQGVFVFTCKEPEDLRIVVAAGAGHRQELTLTKTQIESGAGASSARNATPDRGAAPQPPHEPGAQVGFADGLVGIAFLLALAAFILSVRNANELGRLKQMLDERLPPAP